MPEICGILDPSSTCMGCVMINRQNKRRSSYGCELMRNVQINWFCALLVIPFVWTVKPCLSQVTPNQIPVQNIWSQYLVSKNQLLTPEKALKATDRAREDLWKGRKESARKEVQRALAVAPHCALALNLQGIMGLEDRDYTEAVHAFQQSINEDPTLGPAYLGLGIAFAAEGRFREALIPLDRAAALLPGSWITYFETALARLGLHESLTGLRQIAYAERFAGADVQKISAVAYLRGVAYLQLNDLSSAKEFLLQAVQRDPNGTYAVLAQRSLNSLIRLIR